MPEHSRRAARPTTIWERRLIRAARARDARRAGTLLALYEPMVRRIARMLYLPGGDRDDLAQEARARRDRCGCAGGTRARGVPFSNFARLCAVREARMAVTAARARKHQVLTTAYPLERAVVGEDRRAGGRVARGVLAVGRR